MKALGSYEGEAWVFGDAKEVRHLALITWRGYMLSLLGCPGQDRTAVPMDSKGCRDKPLGKWFQAMVSVLLHVSKLLYSGSPSAVIVSISPQIE